MIYLNKIYMKKCAFFIAAIGLFPLIASAASQSNTAPAYTIDCSTQEARPLCGAPVQHADLAYRILATQMPHCKGDCDLDWLGNDTDNERNAKNDVYALSSDTYLLTHEDAPLGAYGGGDVSLFLMTRAKQSIHFVPLLNEEGKAIKGDRRGWFYNPQQKLIGYSPITDSAGTCEHTYFYTLSSNRLKLNNITVRKETLEMAECRDVKKELGHYPVGISLIEGE